MPEVREVIDIESECSDAKAPEGYSRSNWFSSENWDEPVSQQNRMITMYSLTTPVLQENRRGEWRMKDYEIIRTASQIDIVMTLREIWTQLEGWA